MSKAIPNRLLLFDHFWTTRFEPELKEPRVNVGSLEIVIPEDGDSEELLVEGVLMALEASGFLWRIVPESRRAIAECLTKAGYVLQGC